MLLRRSKVLEVAEWRTLLFEAILQRKRSAEAARCKPPAVHLVKKLTAWARTHLIRRRSNTEDV